MNIANIKKLQDTYAQIDEYKAKYRIHSRAYGWHFGGLQIQGWKIDNIEEPNMSEDGYLELNSGSKITKSKPLFDDKDFKNESYRYFSISFKNINKVNGELKIEIQYSSNSIIHTITIAEYKEDYLIHFNINEIMPSHVTIEFDGNTNRPIYIKYIKFDKEPIIETNNIVDIYDDETIHTFLSKQKNWNENIVVDHISSMYDEIVTKQSDNNCYTCDINTCSCDQAAHGYVPCTTDACTNFMPCTCNATCHLQERIHCYCDQLFYDKDAPKEKAKMSAVGGTIDLLKGIKPKLENLAIVDDSLDKYLHGKSKTVKFRKKDNNKPGYINYELDRHYKIGEPKNEISILENSNGKYEIELGSSASNDYTDLWNQLVAEVEKGDFVGYYKENYDNIQRHLYAKLICFNGTPYLIAWYPGGKDQTPKERNHTYKLYHKLYKVEYKNNRYCLEEKLQVSNTIVSHNCLGPSNMTIFDSSYMNVGRSVNVFIHENNENRLKYELVSSCQYRDNYIYDGRWRDVYSDEFFHEVEITENECKVIYNYHNSQINYPDTNMYSFYYDISNDNATVRPGLMAIRKDGNTRLYLNTKKQGCHKEHLYQVVTKKMNDSYQLWDYYETQLGKHHYDTLQHYDISNPDYKQCPYPEFDRKMYVCAGNYIFGTKTNTLKQGSVERHENGGNEKYLESSPYYYGTVHYVCLSDYAHVAESTLYKWFNENYKDAKIIPYLISPLVTIHSAADNNAQYVTYYSNGIHTGALSGNTALDAALRNSGVSMRFSEISGSGTNIVVGTADRQFYVNEMRIVRFYFQEDLNNKNKGKLYISVDNHLFSYNFDQSNNLISNESEILTLNEGEKIFYIGYSNNQIFVLYKKDKTRVLKYLENKDEINIDANIDENVVYAFVDKFGNFYYETQDMFYIKNHTPQEYTGIHKEVKIDNGSMGSSENSATYNNIKIRVDSNIIEFDTFGLTGTNDDFKNEYGRFSCTCDHTWYGITSCVCDSVNNISYNNCICYMNRY